MTFGRKRDHISCISSVLTWNCVLWLSIGIIEFSKLPLWKLAKILPQILHETFADPFNAPKLCIFELWSDPKFLLVEIKENRKSNWLSIGQIILHVSPFCFKCPNWIPETQKGIARAVIFGPCLPIKNPFELPSHAFYTNKSEHKCQSKHWMEEKQSLIQFLHFKCKGRANSLPSKAFLHFCWKNMLLFWILIWKRYLKDFYDGLQI
jgi:hypothetical protein